MSRESTPVSQPINSELFTSIRHSRTAAALALALLATAPGLASAANENADGAPHVEQQCMPDADGNLGVKVTNGSGSQYDGMTFDINMSPTTGQSLHYNFALSQGAEGTLTPDRVFGTKLTAGNFGQKTLYVEGFDSADNKTFNYAELFCAPQSSPVPTPLPTPRPTPESTPVLTPIPSPIKITPLPSPVIITTPKPIAETTPLPVVTSAPVVNTAPVIDAPSPNQMAAPQLVKIPVIKSGLKKRDIDQAVTDAHLTVGDSYLDTGKKKNRFSKISPTTYKVPKKLHKKLVLEGLGHKAQDNTIVQISPGAQLPEGSAVNELYKLTKGKAKGKGKSFGVTATKSVAPMLAKEDVQAASAPLTWSHEANCTHDSGLFVPYSNAYGYLMSHPELVQEQSNPETIALEKLDCTPTFSWIYKSLDNKTDGYDLKAGIQGQIAQAYTQDLRNEIVMYDIPNRDNGGASSGGAKDDAEYHRTIDETADIINNPTDVILEPDGEADMSSMLNRPDLQAQRIGNLIYGINKLSSNPNIKLYLDAGNEGYNKASTIAGWAYQTGICKGLIGLSFNVSNYFSEESELRYAKNVKSRINVVAQRNGVSDCNPDIILDNSRNGAITTGATFDPDPNLTAAGRYPGTTTLSDGSSYKGAFVNYPGGVDKQVIKDGVTYGPGGWVEANAIALINNPLSGYTNVNNYIKPTPVN